MTDVSNPEARPGRIDAILSTHFDECSISAADASSMAHEQRQPEGGVDRSLHRVGYLETGIPEAFTLKTLGILEVDHPSIIDGTAELTMIYPSSRDEHEELAPFLAAVVNGDVLVPIASFQKRTDGQCSYVQLGQEMVDDNLVVTSNAPRALYVEAIRKLLKEWSTEDHNYEVLPEALLVAEFLKEEVEKFQGSIDALTSKTVCKMAAEYLHDEHDGIDRGDMGLTVINDGQEQLRKTNFRVKSLMHRDEKADKAVVGKEAKLLVGQRVEYVQPQTVPAKKKRFSRKKVQPEVSEPEVVYSGDPELLLSIRGGVAISIARFSSEGRIILNDSGEIADRELARDMVALLDPERAKHRGYLAAAKSVFTQWVETLTERGPVELANPDDLDAYAVGVIANKSGFGLCPEINTVGHLKARSNQYPVYVSELEADWDIFKSKIKDALPKITQPPLRSFCDAILKGVEQDTKKVLEALGVESLLEAQFGPADSPAEELAAQLGKYASRDVHKFAGVLKDHKAGKTITDVDTEVRFENRPGNIRVNVQGRPSALEGMAPVTLFDTVIYFDRRNDLPEAEVMELADVLGNLVFRRAEEATEEYRKFKQTPASAG